MDDLERLAADLTAKAHVTKREVSMVVRRGAINIKKDWRGAASGLKHAPLYPLAIDYDLDDDGLGAEIGPDKEKPQGPLGNLLEFGSVHNQPHNHGGQALEAEEPRFVEALSKLAGL